MRRGVAGVAAFIGLAALAVAPAAYGRTVKLGEYRLSESKAGQLRERWIGQLRSRYGSGWAPMRFELGDTELRLMGLPPKRVLLSRRYTQPTAVYRSGKMVRLGRSKPPGGGGGDQGSASNPGLVTFAGTGFFGIRPGALLLIMGRNSISLCSMAHVYGSPGSYQISTAGHCGKGGDIATVIGVVGDRVPVLIDFGQFKTSTGDGGVGKDWALISIYSRYQHLVTPTMAFWGGPKGMYTATGDVVTIDPRRIPPGITTNPNPTLVQQLVHYGHGLGVGTGGTPRSGTAITWRSSYYTFFGVITPGDSGSGANTLTGDTVGAVREAAGINTHILLGALLDQRYGLGLMTGTRATQVKATLADGQLLPYPAPAPILP